MTDIQEQPRGNIVSRIWSYGWADGRRRRMFDERYCGEGTQLGKLAAYCRGYEAGARHPPFRKEDDDAGPGSQAWADEHEGPFSIAGDDFAGPMMDEGSSP